MNSTIWIAMNVLLLLAREIATGASWDEVMSEYQRCRAQLTDMTHAVEVLSGEIGRLREQIDLHKETEREGFTKFVEYLVEKKNYCEDDLRRVPSLLKQIDKEIDKYEGKSKTCPECIESSTYLLCVTLEELGKDLNRSIRSAQDFSECWSDKEALLDLVRKQREKLKDLETKLRGTQEEDVGQELSQVRELVDRAESSLRQDHKTWSLKYALEARSNLEWLEDALGFDE